MISCEHYAITAESEHGLLRIAMRGLWTVPVVHAYKQAVSDVIASMYRAGCRPGELLALVDMRDATVQSQDVVAAYQTEAGGDIFKSRRLATLATSALLRRQIERVGVANQRLFDDEREALDWLLADPAPMSSAA